MPPLRATDPPPSAPTDIYRRYSNGCVSYKISLLKVGGVNFISGLWVPPPNHQLLRDTTYTQDTSEVTNERLYILYCWLYQFRIRNLVRISLPSPIWTFPKSESLNNPIGFWCCTVHYDNMCVMCRNKRGGVLIFFSLFPPRTMLFRYLSSVLGEKSPWKNSSRLAVGVPPGLSSNPFPPPTYSSGW